MPRTYTANTGIIKPGDGEEAGVWGDLVNDNMDILDRAINGVLSLSLSGTTTTLTTGDGATSGTSTYGQYRVLVLGGSPSGTNTITVSPNDAQKFYFVVNNSGESAVFTQGSGGDVTIADGDSAVIYCDGAGGGAAVVDVSASFVPSLTKAGVTASASELNILDGVTASTAELNVLDGVTASTAELNILDGVTATTAELNILDGVTADATEINVLDGITATTTELNYTDGVTSNIQTQLDAKAPLTSPQLSQATFNDGYTEEVFAVTGTTPALSPTNGSIQTWTLTGNSTPTAGTWAAGQSITLLVDDGSAYSITWTSLSIVWKTNGGVAPTLNTSGVTVIQLWKVATTIYGARVGNA